jgi:tRNA(Ile)-lysidine synthase
VTPTAIRATVRDYIRAHDILRPGPLVVAASGGADSTALLLLLADLADEFGLVLHVAHFDHRTRGRASAEDADFVAKLANRVGAPIRLGRAARPTASEDDARNARYEFLRRAAGEIGATAIATGHTRDDQAETVLLHLTRGSGIAGLAGMRPLANGIARPLLAIGRADTVTICKSARIKPRTDPTNRSTKFARNRVRHKVLPELVKLNPRAAEAIARLADAAADISAAEQARATAALTRASPRARPGGPSDASVARSAASASLARGARDSQDAIALAPLRDDALRGDVLAAAWLRATGRQLTSRHRDALVRLTSTHEGTRSIDLPGGRVIREYDRLRIETRRVPRTEDADVALERGRVTQWNDWRLALGVSIDGTETTTAHVPDALLGKLVVRKRKPGDRTVGMGGRKLQDVFVDAKVPTAERDRWPVISGPEGVWWVPGLTSPASAEGGTALAVAAPKQMGNVLWRGRVREVASKGEAAATRSRRGTP